ncbi:MAG: hypothetical protein Q9157_007210 [Trypethelium eluteriae]
MAANGGFRSATPNKRGQYSDAVLNELESQNDAQVEGISAKVRMLKDVSVSFLSVLGRYFLAGSSNVEVVGDYAWEASWGSMGKEVTDANVRMDEQLTVSIGDEIRDSTALAEKMNDSFDSTRVRLRGTMNRMLRMAERSGKKSHRRELLHEEDDGAYMKVLYIWQGVIQGVHKTYISVRYRIPLKAAIMGLRPIASEMYYYTTKYGRRNRATKEQGRYTE